MGGPAEASTLSLLFMENKKQKFKAGVQILLTTSQLCNFEQVPEPLWASSVQRVDKGTQLRELLEGSLKSCMGRA